MYNSSKYLKGEFVFLLLEWIHVGFIDKLVSMVFQIVVHSTPDIRIT